MKQRPLPVKRAFAVGVIGRFRGGVKCLFEGIVLAANRRAAEASAIAELKQDRPLIDWEAISL